MAVALLGALASLRRAWEGGETLARVERTWRSVWPYSEAALQGWLRAQLALVLGGCFMVLAYPAAALSPTEDRSAQTALDLIFWTGVTGFAAMIVMVISIVLFNVPKRLAPPALRDQEGLLSRWWRLRKIRMPKE